MTWALTFNTATNSTATNSYGPWVQIDAGGSMTLAVGQGTWVFGAKGGTLTITPQ